MLSYTLLGYADPKILAIYIERELTSDVAEKSCTLAISKAIDKLVKTNHHGSTLDPQTLVQFKKDLQEQLNKFDSKTQVQYLKGINKFLASRDFSCPGKNKTTTYLLGAFTLTKPTAYLNPLYNCINEMIKELNNIIIGEKTVTATVKLADQKKDESKIEIKIDRLTPNLTPPAPAISFMLMLGLILIDKATADSNGTCLTSPFEEDVYHSSVHESLYQHYQVLSSDYLANQLFYFWAIQHDTYLKNEPGNYSTKKERENFIRLVSQPGDRVLVEGLGDEISGPCSEPKFKVNLPGTLFCRGWENTGVFEKIASQFRPYEQAIQTAKVFNQQATIILNNSPFKSNPGMYRGLYDLLEKLAQRVKSLDSKLYKKIKKEMASLSTILTDIEIHKKTKDQKDFLRVSAALCEKISDKLEIGLNVITLGNDKEIIETRNRNALKLVDQFREENLLRKKQGKKPFTTHVVMGAAHIFPDRLLEKVGTETPVKLDDLSASDAQYELRSTQEKDSAFILPLRFS